MHVQACMIPEVDIRRYQMKMAVNKPRRVFQMKPVWPTP